MQILKRKTNRAFESNLGQLPNDISFKLKSVRYTTFFTKEKVIFSLPSNKADCKNVFYMKLENTNKNINISGKEKQVGTINYLIGNDESKWITNVPTYAKIKYEGIYDNIDLYYYINNENLEYDLVLYNGAKSEDISISFEGLDNIEVDGTDEIVLTIGDAKVKLLKPIVYQFIDNKKIYIDCEYKINEENGINFLVGKYEKEYELVLDPIIQLEYLGYIGGVDEDKGNAIDVDEQGCVYITGDTKRYFPVTAGAFQIYNNGESDLFVSKFSADGKTLMYSTYIGGSYNDYGEGISVDEFGNAYITGYTESTNYPVTTGVFNNHKNSTDNMDVVVTKLNKTGSGLIYSTYIIGGDYKGYNSYGVDIVADNLGFAYITGYSEGDYPVTSEAYRGSNYYVDAFVTKLNQDGSRIVYSTYLGGTGYDYATSLDIDNEGYAYIVGYTDSKDYPVTSTAYQRKHVSDNGTYDGFITKINQTGTDIVYSTYIGGSGSDKINGIDIDDEGFACVAGCTSSTNYPTTSGAYQSSHNKDNGNYDGFVTKLNKDASELLYSTYLGGNDVDIIKGIKVDKSGNIYVAGYTMSSNYPVTPGAYQSKYSGYFNIVLTILDPSKSLLLYSTYIGEWYNVGLAIAVDKYNGVYITGYGDESFQSIGDVVVAKLDSIDINLYWENTPKEAKLLDTVITNLNIKNMSSTKLDVKVTYDLLDSPLKFIPNSLRVQGVSQITDSIPEQIYILNIPSRECAEVKMKLQYIIEVFPHKIPIVVTVEVYSNIDGKRKLLKKFKRTFDIKTKIGPNYIPGCNQLYNIAIDGVIKTTTSRIPIVYCKSGTSYIYIEPTNDKYLYKVLTSTGNIVEYPITI